MATVEQLDARILPFKFALVEAFGLDPDNTVRDVSANAESVTFTQVTIDLAVLSYTTVFSNNEFVTVEIPARHWTDQQRNAVHDYINQFNGSEQP